MKKILTLIFCLLLVSCGTNRDLEQAKEELLNGTNTGTSTESVSENETSSDNVNTKDATKSEGITIRHSSGTPLLDFDTLSLDDVLAGEIEIRGTADTSVEKIEVLFSNNNSDFPNDKYILQTYKGKGGSFRYVASSKNQVLDFWKNSYEFRAYTGKEYETSFVDINLPREDLNSQDEKREDESVLIGPEDDILSINLPTSSKYGEPIRLGEKWFTYSQIKGLEVNKKIIEDLTCETVTDYLKKSLGGWFYWNSCRDIVKDKGIHFNVVRLDGDEYVYERHYVDFKHGLYGTYELERGTGVDSDSIAEKNTELKEKTYDVEDIVDGLMQDIVKS